MRDIKISVSEEQAMSQKCHECEPIPFSNINDDGPYVILCPAHTALAAEVASLRSLLRDLEWQGYVLATGNVAFICCPSCKSVDGAADKHEPDCRLATAIGVER